MRSVQPARADTTEKEGFAGRTVEVAVALDKDDTVSGGQLLGQDGCAVHAAVAAAEDDDVAERRVRGVGSGGRGAAGQRDAGSDTRHGVVWRDEVVVGGASGARTEGQTRVGGAGDRKRKQELERGAAGRSGGGGDADAAGRPRFSAKPAAHRGEFAVADSGGGTRDCPCAAPRRTQAPRRRRRRHARGNRISRCRLGHSALVPAGAPARMYTP